MTTPLSEQKRPSKNKCFARQIAERIEAVDKEVADFQSAFASHDTNARRLLIDAAHTPDRFENYEPDAETISQTDARLLIANKHGFALWKKFESYLHLLPPVVGIIEAIDLDDEETVEEILREEPEAANPTWVKGYKPVGGYFYPNDSIPLHRVCQAYNGRLIDNDTSYRIAKRLLDAGADPDFHDGLPMSSAVSYGALRVAEALLDAGAAVDGVDGDGLPMAYPLHFGRTDVAEYLAERGATLDLRFAAGLGKLDLVKSFFNEDGTVKPDSMQLADPYGHETKREGKNVVQAERTTQNILMQAMYFACKNARLEAVAFLLDHVEDINAVVPGLDIEAPILHRIALFESDPSGDVDSIGFAATEKRLLPVIQFLLEHGADPNVRDPRFDASALGWAQHTVTSSEAVVGLLEKYMRL